MDPEARRSRDYYERRAPIYDWSNKIAALLRGVSDVAERRKAMGRLGIRPGHRVLEVCSGTGTNLVLMAEQVAPNGRLVGLDISPAMIHVSRTKLRKRNAEADTVVGDAARLPFADDQFNAVFHHGGIAEFGDRRGAIAEMARVARPGAKVVICDPGIPEHGRTSLANGILLLFQPQYVKHPPVDLLTPDAADVNLGWIQNGSWYILEFRKPFPTE